MVTEVMNPLALELQGLALMGDRPLPQLDASRQTAPAQRNELPPPACGLPLTLKGIGKAYGERQVLRDVNLNIAPGEFVAIVGRSGCGKSTLLRLLAQLEAADAGPIAADGTQPLAARREDIRILFQDARLLPWKRVVDNVALGLEGHWVRERATEALAQVGLADRANEWPAVLSGGQRQRMALARALAHAPRRLLIEDQQISLDRHVALPRPRSHAGAAFARYEAEILQRVLRQPEAGSRAGARAVVAAGEPAALRALNLRS